MRPSSPYVWLEVQLITPDGSGRPVAAVSDAAMNAALGVLSQDQLEALRALQFAQQSQRQLAALKASPPTAVSGKP